MFCIYFKLDYLPTNIEVLALYVQFLSRSFASVISIKNYVNGVKILHLGLGLKFPELDYSYKLLLKGIARTNPHEEVQALPITPTVLLRMHAVMDLTKSFDRALWAAFLLGFYLFARKSNLVPPSQHAYDFKRHLARGDIHISDVGLVVLIKWSKTIQAGERHILVPVLEVPGSPLCPRAAFVALINGTPAHGNAPAFVYSSPQGLSTLTYSTFVSSLKHLLNKAGLDCKGYSGHSFRRGGASFAFQAGVPGELIQLHGDWRSDAYLRYLTVPMQHRLKVTNLMRTLILKEP